MLLKRENRGAEKENRWGGDGKERREEEEEEGEEEGKDGNEIRVDFPLKKKNDQDTEFLL